MENRPPHYPTRGLAILCSSTSPPGSRYQNAMLHFISPQGSVASADGGKHFVPQLRRLSVGPGIAIATSVNLSQSRPKAVKQRQLATRHEFVIGPLCVTSVFHKPARVYYCMRCQWSFLVLGSKVAVLDDHGRPVCCDESLQRFRTFREGPCPVLQEFISAEPFNPVASEFRPRSESGTDSDPGQPCPRSDRRPLLRVVSRRYKNSAGADPSRVAAIARR